MSGFFSNSMMMGEFAAYGIAHAALLDGSTGYLSITLTTSATHSGSVWVQRTKLGAVQPVLDNQVYFNASDQLVVNGLTSTAVYRDPTAVYHIFWNATGAWVNGVAVSGAGSYATASIVNPRLGYDGTNYADHYIAAFALFDGTSESLTGGESDPVTGNWIAKTPTGSPHTYMKFGNGVGLGDNTGSGNDWAVSGTVTQVTSTPTNTACTWSPLHPQGNATTTLASPVYSNGNNTVTSTGTWNGTFGTLQCPEKFYFRGNVDNNGSAGRVQTGVVSVAEVGEKPSLSADPGAQAGYWVVAERHEVPDIRKGNAGFTTLSATNYANGDYIDVWGDLTSGDGNGKIWFGKNGTPWEGDPEAGTGASFTNVAGEVIPIIAGFSGSIVTADFLSGSGTFKALTTNNLPKVSDNVDNHFQTVLVAHDGTPTDFTLNWDADIDDTLFWIKRRGGAENHYLVDTLRGMDKYLSTSTNNEQLTDANIISKSGTTITLGSTLAADDYVIWAFRAGAVAGRSTNTDGTITTTVSVNSVTKFSIATWTGTATSGATVGHGLGQIPGHAIVKNYSNASGYTWANYTHVLGGTKVLFLSSTGAASTNSAYWNNADADTTNLTLGSTTATNGSGNSIIGYFFGSDSPFIKIGLYTGNGSTDGPFVNEMVSPVWVLLKRTDSADSWTVRDSARDPHNPVLARLDPNSSLAESNSTVSEMDFTAVGFKHRENDPQTNASGGTYVYLMIGQPQGPTENTAR